MTLVVLTAHHLSGAWVAIQTAKLRRYAPSAVLVASLEGVDPGLAAHFDHVVPSVGTHDGKLNLMAAFACRTWAPDDVLVFLDGDAFPVAPIEQWVQDGLAAHDIMAVRRGENAGEARPHPAFAALTVRTWLAVQGDWSSGHVSPGPFGPSTDVGANMLWRHEQGELTWSRVERSHSLSTHPLFHAVYGDRVYHHGAGFRGAMSVVDHTMAPSAPARTIRNVPQRVHRRLWVEARQARNRAESTRVQRSILASRDWVEERMRDSATRPGVPAQTNSGSA